MAYPRRELLIGQQFGAQLQQPGGQFRLSGGERRLCARSGGVDPDWQAQFISYGGRPSEMGGLDIRRLTGAGQARGSVGDYQSLKYGIDTLEIEKIDKRKPLYDPVNLHAAAVRLMVVKKKNWLWHKDHDAVTYSYDRLRAMMVAIA
jgi:hypothetical protein